MADLRLFNEHGMALMQNLAAELKRKKEIEAHEKALKADLLKLMEQYGVKSVDNEYLKITYVDGCESVTLDVKALEISEQELYNDLLRDYPKVAKRAPSVRITVR